MVTQPGTQEEEAGGPEDVQGHPYLQIDFKTSMGYMRQLSKTKQTDSPLLYWVHVRSAH